jgi:peptide-methionine (S)-S-oxide reductase
MSKAPTETATLGGGCFWCLEAVFEQLQGVHSIQSGYSGGTRPNPSYEQICSGATGHAEVVQIVFDLSVTPYLEVLQIFFSIHDPTTLNRQGNDVGTQYRSVIFSHSEKQRDIARTIIEELDQSGVFSAPVVTELVPLEHFYPAEDYHQGYFRQNSEQPYCQYVIDPKVAKFRAQYFDKLKN